MTNANKPIPSVGTVAMATTIFLHLPDDTMLSLAISTNIDERSNVAMVDHSVKPCQTRRAISTHARLSKKFYALSGVCILQIVQASTIAFHHLHVLLVAERLSHRQTPTPW